MHSLTSAITDSIILKLQLAAKEKGITELSKATGIGRGNLYHMFNRHKNPTVETLTKVALALGFTLKLEPNK